MTTIVSNRRKKDMITIQKEDQRLPRLWICESTIKTVANVLVEFCSQNSVELFSGNVNFDRSSPTRLSSLSSPTRLSSLSSLTHLSSLSTCSSLQRDRFEL
ncbi:hypothetical protein CDAR_95531 [Caerostris darwini]|uniref:Uncharacterized protein n=1 Tax=Caerostris darwini TaxID=1538125 RepID=A0AAV4M7A3_9ARAC|nr:hypothetical protein CDAR_95531 [Caerostris darwini]